MVKTLNFNSIESHQAVFRIGIFLPYIESKMSEWISIRDHLRRNGFYSTFLVQDYPNASRFTDVRMKSFHFLHSCHVPLFILPDQVGTGGVVSELEEFVREVFPKKKMKGGILIKSAFEEVIRDKASSVVLPTINEEHFRIGRFLTIDELPGLILGMASDFFYGLLKRSYYLLDYPEYRLLCDHCGGRESSFMCLGRCKEDCNKYHFCRECCDSIKGSDCENIEHSLYALPSRPKDL